MVSCSYVIRAFYRWRIVRLLIIDDDMLSERRV